MVACRMAVPKPVASVGNAEAEGRSSSRKVTTSDNSSGASATRKARNSSVLSSAQCRSSRTQTAGPRAASSSRRALKIWCGQHVLELRQDRPQRPDDRAERSMQPLPIQAAEGLDDRAERERLAQRVAVADQHTHAAQLGRGERLAHQRALAHARHTFDEDQARSTERGVEEEAALTLAPDEAR